MRFRLPSLFALALGVLALAPPAPAAGPIRDRLRERHPVAAGVFNAVRPGLLLAKPSACPCPQCPPQLAPPAAPAAPPACPGGVCPLPGKVVGATAAPEPQVVGGVFDRLSDGPIRRKILLEVVRNGAERKLASEKGITRAAAKELVDRVSDETILTHVQQKWGAAADGGRLENFLNWVLAHKEEIIKFIMLIVSLFASDG